MTRFATKEDMQPLLDLCRQGKLFDVQAWIAAGKPVNPPLPEPKKRRWTGPLEEAVDQGFHSLVKVLIEGGANMVEHHNYDFGKFCALSRAVSYKRMDLIELLVEHGADPKTVHMWTVFDTWDPEIMRYFIDRGADVVTDNPIAYAFASKIRPALGIYKRYEAVFPDWKRQINIALRGHTADQNQKWVSLLLWAGADPYAVGARDCQETQDYEESALEIAIWRDWEWMLKHVKRLGPTKETALPLLTGACHTKNPKTITRLIEAGFLEVISPSDISDLVGGLMRLASYRRYALDPGLVALELILSTGAKWIPDPDEIKYTRRRMIKDHPEGFKAVVMLMKKHAACTEEILHELARTGTAQRLLLAK